MRTSRTLLLASVLLALVPGLAIEAWNVVAMRAERDHEVRENALRISQLVHADIASIVDGARATMVAAALLPDIRSGTGDRCRGRLDALQSAFPRYRRLSAFAADGRVRCSTSPTAAPTLGDPDWARPSPDPAIGLFTIGRDCQSGCLPLSMAFADGPDGPALVLEFALDLGWLSQRLAAQRLPADSVTAVVDRAGTILARSQEQALFLGTPILPEAMPLLGARAPGVVPLMSVDGRARMIGYVPLDTPPRGIYVGAAVNADGILPELDGTVRREAALLAVAYLAALALAWTAGIRIDRLRARLRLRADELECNNRRLLEEMDRRSVAEERLRQAERLDALGKLAGGVAHDFNNLLQIIIGSGEIIQRRIGPADRRLVDTLLDAATRGAKLASQLLTFSRRRPTTPAPIDLVLLIRSFATGLLPRTLNRPDIAIELALPGQPCIVAIDSDALDVALVNLAANARDAMPAGGTLRLSLERTDAAVLPGTARPGAFALLRVADTGIGMTPDVRARAFDPFFTTKASDRGTGLGLSQVYGFVEQADGLVTLDSAPGAGTTVSLYLPLAEAAASLPPAAAAGPAAGPGLRVLVVEDNLELAQVVGGMLAGLGHIVVGTAHRARDALALIDSVTPDLLLSDVMMPDGMTGLDLAREVRRRYPDLPVVLMTGYTEAEDRVVAEFATLRKPFRAEQLDQALKTLTQRA